MVARLVDRIASRWLRWRGQAVEQNSKSIWRDTQARADLRLPDRFDALHDQAGQRDVKDAVYHAYLGNCVGIQRLNAVGIHNLDGIKPVMDFDRGYLTGLR